MSELEDRINSVLNDPKQMEQIMGMARSLMGGEDGAGAPSGGGLASLLQGAAGGEPAEPGLMSRLGSALREDSGERDRRALLEAMKPWLSEKRRGKIDRALRLSKMAHIALSMLGEAGGEGHV